MTQITLQGNSIHTNGTIPGIESQAKNFVLVDQELNNITLDFFKQKRKLIYTIPSLDTGVCAASTKKFNKFAEKNDNTAIIVVSADLPFAQIRFCTHEDVKNIYTLSMMRSNDFAKDYGILIIDGPFSGLLARAIIVLNEKNQVIYNELVPEIAQEPDYETALKSLKG